MSKKMAAFQRQIDDANKKLSSLVELKLAQQKTEKVLESKADMDEVTEINEKMKSVVYKEELMQVKNYIATKADKTAL